MRAGMWRRRRLARGHTCRKRCLQLPRGELTVFFDLDLHVAVDLRQLGVAPRRAPVAQREQPGTQVLLGVSAQVGDDVFDVP